MFWSVSDDYLFLTRWKLSSNKNVSTRTCPFERIDVNVFVGRIPSIGRFPCISRARGAKRKNFFFMNFQTEKINLCEFRRFLTKNWFWQNLCEWRPFHRNSVSIRVIRAILAVGQSKSIFVGIVLKMFETRRKQKTIFSSKFKKKNSCPFAVSTVKPTTNPRNVRIHFV